MRGVPQGACETRTRARVRIKAMKTSIGGRKRIRRGLRVKGL